ncbi:MAG: hypothetical protein ABI538_00365 [Pseudoxanthomonas sp.]
MGGRFIARDPASLDRNGVTGQGKPDHGDAYWGAYARSVRMQAIDGMAVAQEIVERKALVLIKQAVVIRCAGAG